MKNTKDNTATSTLHQDVRYHVQELIYQIAKATEATQELIKHLERATYHNAEALGAIIAAEGSC